MVCCRTALHFAGSAMMSQHGCNAVPLLVSLVRSRSCGQPCRCMRGVNIFSVVCTIVSTRAQESSYQAPVHHPMA